MRFHVAPSATNFLLVSTAPLNRKSGEVVAHLRQSNIYVADFAGYSGLDATWFRVTIGQREENRALVKSLTNYVASVNFSA